MGTSFSKQPGNFERTSLKLSTRTIPPQQRYEWLREVICREYTQVDIISPVRTDLSQDLSIFGCGNLQLSYIHSSAIELQRLPTEPHRHDQDAYFAVLLVTGQYLLEQNGKEVSLQPGDMTLYDATRAHRIHCPGQFSKLILSIPRPALKQRVAGIDACTAMRIPGANGVGSVAANFLHTFAIQAEQLQANELSTLSDHALDLLSLAVTSVRPTDINLSSSRLAALNNIKTFIDHHLHDATLDSRQISAYAGLSVRYINKLFKEEETSLMRYVWKRRLEKCRQDILNPEFAGRRLSDIAYYWGFNDMAHFSRTFKQRFGCSPREFRGAANLSQ